jgi:hypothetical protein
MNRTALVTIFLLLAYAAAAAQAETVKTTWGGPAELIYDTGFMHMLKKNPGGGVSLFDMELIQNDAPGAGASE